MSRVTYVSFDTKHKYFRKEDVESTRKYLNLNFDDLDMMTEFYKSEYNKKYIIEIGSRGGIKRSTLRDARNWNPFLNKDNNSNFQTLNEHREYISKINKDKSKVDEEVEKFRTVSIFLLVIGFFLLGIMLAMIIGNSILRLPSTLDNEVSSAWNIFWLITILAIVGSLAGVGLIIFGRHFYLKSHWTEQIFCKSINFLDRDSYFMLYQNVSYKSEGKIIKNILQSVPPISSIHIKKGTYLNSNQGIYLIKIGQSFDLKNEYNLPIYVGKANQLANRWKQHLNNLQKVIKDDTTNIELKYHKMISYMIHNNLTLDNVEFYILEQNFNNNWSENELKEKETNWIAKTEAGTRGFNAIR